MFLRLQNKDGSFPRKFKDDFSIVDKSGEVPFGNFAIGYGI